MLGDFHASAGPICHGVGHRGVEFGRIWADFDQLWLQVDKGWPSSAEFGPMLVDVRSISTDFGQVRPILARITRFGTSSTVFGPNLLTFGSGSGKVGKVLAKFVQSRPRLGGLRATCCRMLGNFRRPPSIDIGPNSDEIGKQSSDFDPNLVEHLAGRPDCANHPTVATIPRDPIRSRPHQRHPDLRSLVEHPASKSTCLDPHNGSRTHAGNASAAQ